MAFSDCHCNTAQGSQSHLFSSMLEIEPRTLGILDLVSYTSSPHIYVLWLCLFVYRVIENQVPKDLVQGQTAVV